MNKIVFNNMKTEIFQNYIIQLIKDVIKIKILLQMKIKNDSGVE